MTNAQIGQYATVLVGNARYSGEVVYITATGARSVMTVTGAVATGVEILATV